MGNSGTKPQSSMSNGQMQTRGLSAADWTRLKRLNGAKNYKSVNLDTDKDIAPPVQPQLPYRLPIHVYRSAGTSKIRRPASDWIAYKASQTADYPTPSGTIGAPVDMGTAQVMTRLCDCSNNVLNTKVAGCISCQYSPIENYTSIPDQGGPQPGVAGTLEFTGGSTPSYLRLANKEGLRLGIVDFTIEWFMNMSSSNPSFPRVFAFSKGSVGSGTQVYGVSIEGGTFYFWNNNSPVDFGDFGSIPNAYDTWHHIAVVGYGGSVIRVFVDGTQFGSTATSSYNFTDVDAELNIGAYPQDTAQSNVSFVGFLSNFRILKGTALYTSDFTKPTAPLPPISTSVIWLKSETSDTAYVDSSVDSINSVITTQGPSPPVWSSQLVS